MKNIDLNELEKKYNTVTYCLTDEANQLIKDNYIYIINKNKNYDFTDFEIKEAYRNAPNWASNNDIIWGIFNERNITLVHKKEWGLYRNNLLNMGFLLHEEKKYLQALHFFIAVFNIDISGMGNGNYVDDLTDMLLVPYIPKQICNLLKLCNIDSIQLKSIFEEACNNYCSSLPFKYYSPEVAYEILLDTLNGKTFKCKKYKYNIPSKQSTNYLFYGYHNEIKENANKVNCNGSTNVLKRQVQNATINSNISNSTTKRKKKYSLLLDLILIFCTAGLWIIWMIVRPKYEY